MKKSPRLCPNALMLLRPASYVEPVQCEKFDC
jgi:hypothetical protein